MINEEAIYYLKSSGMSDEQIKSVIDAFTCEDCISRKAAIDVVRKWFDKIQLNGDICLDGIISLPPVTPQQKWIPVSEKPQEGRYLCTYEHYDGKCIDFGSFDGKVWYIKPIAYMPLPQPYAESEE